MKVQYKTLLASILLVLVSLTCTAAQAEPPRPRRGPPPPPGLPIDGFSSIVLVLGVIYGAKKGYQLLKDDNQ